MAHATSTMDQVWTDFQALPPESRVALLQRILTNEELRDELEDASDLLVIAERANQPSRPFAEVMTEMRARTALTRS